MAEEPAVGYDGFDAPAGAGGVAVGGAEDNLSMPLGDFMAFLETEPAPPEQGGEEEEDQQHPGVSCLSPCPNSLCAGFRDVGSDLAGWGCVQGRVLGCAEAEFVGYLAEFLLPAWRFWMIWGLLDAVPFGICSASAGSRGR